MMRFKFKSEPVPGVDGVFVKELAADQLDTVDEAFGGDTPVKEQMAKAAIMFAVDEKGNKLYKDADLKGLCEEPFRVLEAIFNAVMKLNGWDDLDLKKNQ